MRAIVAADENWGIGRNGKLLVSIPKDMKFFRNETAGKVVVMGRRTLESLPGKSPLEGRKNIILSRNPDYTVKNAETVSSVEELLERLKEYPPEDVYCIGGGVIYELLLPYCDAVFVTRIHYAYEADTRFPNLDEDPQWVLAGSSEEEIYFDLEYEFNRYERLR